ncbi:MAG: thioredoxin-disulfide reductase [Leptolinea sp.]|nr:thioredoxin-disulfide reductase [Leptolinea sp.]
MVVQSNTAEEETNPFEKIIILGSGPAGLAAALYAARAELNPLVISGVELGGQAALTNTIENYPGFPEGIGGYELGELFKKQAERFGARVQFATATDVDLQMSPYTIVTDSGKYKTSSLVIATGASPNHLNIPGEKEFTGKGVSYCATCDGWFFKEKEVVVVGGGDSAVEEALFLTRFASSVKIIHRRDTLRAGALLQKRANENPKISFVWNSVVEEINGAGKVTSLRIRNTRSGEESTLTTDGIFIFIGHTPNTQLFHGQLSMDDKGFIKTNLLMETSVPGVFAAGEAADSHFRQVITSAGMGAAAAIQATHYLEDK